MRTIRNLLVGLFALLLASPALGQTGSSKSAATLATETNVFFPDNATGAITPFNTRQTLLDIIASYGNLNQTLGGVLTGTLPNPGLGTGVVATSNLAANAVNNAALATAPANTLKCNPTGGTATPTDCTLGAGLAFSGSSLISTANSGNVFNILNSPYLAKCNYKAVTDAAMTSASTTLTSATAGFAAGDVGKYIAVQGAAAAGANLFSAIATFVNATTITLNDANASGGNISSKTIEWGNDDTTNIQAAVNAAAPTGGIVYIPGGSKCLLSRLNLTGLSNSLTIQGDGLNASLIFPLQVASYGTTSGHMFDLTGSSFIRLNNFQIGAFYELAAPTTAIFMAQVGSGASNRNGIDHMYVSGQFTSSTFYNYGVPSLFTIKDSDFYNYRAGAGTQSTMVLTASNIDSLTSSFTTVAVGAQSTSDIAFLQTEFHKFSGAGGNNGVIRLDGASNVSWFSGVVSGGATQYLTLTGTLGALTFRNVTFETESQPVTPTNGYNVGASTFTIIDDVGSLYILGGSKFSSAVTTNTTQNFSH